MVSLIGEAGAGKSRLVAELKQHALAGGAPLRWLQGTCLEMGIPAGYAPFLDILRAYFAWTAADDDRTRGCVHLLRPERAGGAGTPGAGAGG